MSENQNTGPEFAYQKVLVSAPTVDDAVIDLVKKQIEQNKTFVVLSSIGELTSYILMQVLKEVEHSKLTLGTLDDGEDMKTTLGLEVFNWDDDEFIESTAEFSDFRTLPRDLRNLETIILVEPYCINAEWLVGELAANNEIADGLVNVYLVGHDPEYAEEEGRFSSSYITRLREWVGNG